MTPPDGSAFRTIANPYIVGNPIESQDMFFGREDDFEFIRKRVVAEMKGGLLVLCGARRSGKTSILFQIKGGRLGPGFLPVLIDMQSMTVQDDGGFLAKLAQEIIRGVNHPGISYKSDYLASAARNPFDAFQALIQIINLKMPDRKLVLMFDEYELIETHLAKGRFSLDILNLLANWMEHREGVFIVFTGSDKLETRDKHVWANFLGKALHRRISFLSHDDTLRLIHEPVQGLVRYDDGVPELLFHLTAGQPFYTQVLCQALVDHLNEEQKYQVSVADVQQVVAEMIENPLPQMIFSWSSLTDTEKLCLSSLAELGAEKNDPRTFEEIYAYPRDKKTGWRFDEKKLHEAVERLFHSDLLSKPADGEGFLFKMDLWRRWVVRMHSIWQVVDEITEKGRRPDEGIRSDLPRSRGRFLWPLGAVLVLAAIFGIRQLIPPQPPPSVPKQGGVAVVPADSGWVTIDSAPPGAWVYLDNTRLGKTPLPPVKIPAGTFALQLEADGYRARQDTMTVAADDTLPVFLTLAESTGDLKLVSDPRGATISIDGTNPGLVTPAVVHDLPTRLPHAATVSLKGYLPRTRDGITLLPDTTVTITFTLAAITYDLTVRSRPDSSKVLWDGEAKGLTPMVLTGIHGGAHTLEIQSAGYYNHRRQLTFPGTDETYTAQLQLLPPGSLVFMVRPYANIFINGELVKSGVSNFEITRPQGDYDIRLEHPEFPPFQKRLAVTAGQSDTLSYDFRH